MHRWPVRQDGGRQRAAGDAGRVPDSAAELFPVLPSAILGPRARLQSWQSHTLPFKEGSKEDIFLVKSRDERNPPKLIMPGMNDTRLRRCFVLFSPPTNPKAPLKKSPWRAGLRARSGSPPRSGCGCRQNSGNTRTTGTRERWRQGRYGATCVCGVLRTRRSARQYPWGLRRSIPRRPPLTERHSWQE